MGKVDQTQTIIHCTATITAVQTSRPRHQSVNQIFERADAKTQNGIRYPSCTQSSYHTAHRTEPSLSREGGESNVGLTTSQMELDRRRPFPKQKATFSYF
jgi:hypothetical protein